MSKSIDPFERGRNPDEIFPDAKVKKVRGFVPVERGKKIVGAINIHADTFHNKLIDAITNRSDGGNDEA